jgi:hypothetical protein
MEMTVVWVMLATALALPVLLLAAFFLGPVVLVPVLVLACAAPFVLIEGAVLRHHRKP